MNLDKELQLAIRLAVEAGQAILQVYNTAFEVEYKEDDSPLTEADKAANRLIVKGLKNSFPVYAVLSEEEKDQLDRLRNDWCWIVDPLDGTREFVKRNGEFTVNIALAYQHREVLGVIYLPVSGELYYASKGKGAFYQVGDKNEAIAIHVSARKKNLRLLMSRSHASTRLQELVKKNGIVNISRAGSSLKGALLARGEAELYYRFNPTNEWDTAAMQCIVEEAGGIFRQLDGSEMIYNREDTINKKGFYIVNSQDNLLK